jgi:DNA polymerase I-like protein with 3'-5' exonuclease and polymerase domains
MDNLLTLDIETVGTNPRQGKIVSIQCGYENGNCVYKDLWSDDWTAYQAEVVAMAKDPGCTKLIHNAVYEYGWFDQTYGIPITNFEDTMLLPFVLDQGVPFTYTGDPKRDNPEKLKSVGLKRMINYYFPELSTEENDLFKRLSTQKQAGITGVVKALFLDTTSSLETIFPKKRKILEEFGIYHRSDLYAVFKSYGLNDVRYPPYIWRKFKAYKDNEAYQNEKRVIPELVALNRKGVPVDVDYYRKLRSQYVRRIDESIAKIREMVGDPSFDPAKKRDVASVLEARGHTLQPAKKGKGKQTNKKALLQISDPIIEHIKEHGQLTAFVSQHIDGILGNMESDGRVHINYLSAGTVHGRMSSKNPNMMNLPTTDIRAGLVAEEGRSLVCIDYSQIELRVGARYLNDAAWIEEYNKANPDLHWRTVSELLGPDSNISLRKSFGKAFNFGISYGMGVNKLAGMLAEALGGAPSDYIGPAYKQYSEYLSKWSENKRIGYRPPEAFVVGPNTDENLEAQLGKAYIISRNFKKIHPSFVHFKKRVEEAFRTKGYVRSMYDRRFCIPPRMYYKCLEYLTSGHATGDLIKEKLVACAQYLAGSPNYVCACIHDELVFMVRDQDIDVVVPALKAIMEDVPKINTVLPIIAEVEIGKNLEETYPWPAKEEHESAASA